jgi:hypothetical protein
MLKNQDFSAGRSRPVIDVYVMSHFGRRQTVRLEPRRVTSCILISCFCQASSHDATLRWGPTSVPEQSAGTRVRE